MPQELPGFDPYLVLGVSRDATTAQIDAAWKALLRRHHPDVATDKATAEATTKRLNAAHDWLTDPVRRARIDASRRTQAPPPPRQRAHPTPPPPPSPRRAPAAPTSPSKRTTRPWVIGAAIAGILAIAVVGPSLGRSTEPSVAAATAPAESCDASYRTICVPIGIGDLDCRDIAAAAFPVHRPDRHRFDEDGDGIGCE